MTAKTSTSTRTSAPIPDRDTPIIVDAMGVKTTIRATVFDDWRLVELLAAMETNATPAAIVKFMRTVLGDQYERVMRELELEDGSLPTERVTDYMQALMEGVNPNS